MLDNNRPINRFSFGILQLGFEMRLNDVVNIGILRIILDTGTKNPWNLNPGTKYFIRERSFGLYQDTLGLMTQNSKGD